MHFPAMRQGVCRRFHLHMNEVTDSGSGGGGGGGSGDFTHYLRGGGGCSRSAPDSRVIISFPAFCTVLKGGTCILVSFPFPAMRQGLCHLHMNAATEVAYDERSADSVADVALLDVTQVVGVLKHSSPNSPPRSIHCKFLC
jgi:hypothetical protein